MNKNIILNSNHGQPKKINVPEWGGDIYIGEMSVGERLEFVNSITGGDKHIFDLSRLLQLAVVDENNDRLFTDEDLPVLKSKSWRVSDKVVSAWLDYNGLAAKSTEAAEKN